MDYLLIYVPLKTKIEKQNNFKISFYVCSVSLFFQALFYVLDNILDKMLPSQLQNFDEPLSEEGIKEDILRRIRQIVQESSLLRQNSGNVTVDYGVINRQSHLIFQLRARERIFQAEQRKTVRTLNNA